MSAFNEQSFENKLINLKDSQESINHLSTWCLQNREHHKKVVNCWLHCFKRVKVDQRLSLFYLANDVIQYSKRKHYPYVESWGTAIQQATTLVRDERVRNKILRIFRIWEDRGVYDGTFISDLCGLLSTNIKKKSEISVDSSEFQAPVLVKKIQECTTLENETDLRFKRVKENKLPLTDADSMRMTLKDRRQGSDIVAEVEQGVKKMEAYVKALEKEIRDREKLVILLSQAAMFYDKQRGEAKIVFNAYRNFGNKVKLFKKKLDELLPTLIESPIPSPDVNAPSPSPDSDIELPNDKSAEMPQVTENNGLDFTFMNNSSFIGNGSQLLLDFDIQGDIFQNEKIMESSRLSVSQTSEPQAIEVINTRQDSKPNPSFNISDFIKSLMPEQNNKADLPPTPVSPPVVPIPEIPNRLQPPPMPPGFSSTAPPPFLNTWNAEPEPKLPDWTPTEPPPKLDWDDKGKLQGWNMSEPPPKIPWEETIDKSKITWSASEPPPKINWDDPPEKWVAPESKLPGWEMAPIPKEWENNDWTNVNEILDTPESPPLYEKEGVNQPVEYDDTEPVPPIADIDHRTLLPVVQPDMDHRLSQDMDHRIGVRHRGLDVDHRPTTKDIDHRNLISLTGSPKSDQKPLLPPPAFVWPVPEDTDYREGSAHDKIDLDFRVPPPSKNAKADIGGDIERKDSNIESVDMDVSEDDEEVPNTQHNDFDPSFSNFDMSSSFLNNASEEVNDRIKSLLGQAQMGGAIIPEDADRSNSNSRDIDAISPIVSESSNNSYVQNSAVVVAKPETDFTSDLLDIDEDCRPNKNVAENKVENLRLPEQHRTEQVRNNHVDRVGWNRGFRGMRFPYRHPPPPPPPLHMRPDYNRGRGGNFRNYRPRRW